MYVNTTIPLFKLSCPLLKFQFQIFKKFDPYPYVTIHGTNSSYLLTAPSPSASSPLLCHQMTDEFHRFIDLS